MAKGRKSEPEEEESSYNWMDTYGDLVTNLLCFFVLLYAFSSVDVNKWNQLVAAFTGSSGTTVVQSFDVSFAREKAINVVDPMVNYENREFDPDEEIAQRPQPDPSNVESQKSVGDAMDELYMKIQEFIEENDLQDNMSVVRTEEIITIRFGEVFLFESGSAELREETDELLYKIILLITENIEAIKRITIEGHTDNVPISGRYRDNWDLSTARAVNTLQKVLKYELIHPQMLNASGCGEYWPVDTNETDEGRQHNRRVDFVIQKLDT